MAEKYGKVYIVGAGSGCIHLVSVKALHILRSCDCVLYDRLIGKEILKLIPGNVELVYVGKEHHTHIRTQQEINRLLIDKARKYKSVVRLKGGDPMIFGRATEEIKILLEHNIKFEIVPGITALTAASSCAGIVLTDRDTASSVTIVTGQSAEGKPTKINFESLVKLGGTIVFYMTVENMKMICQKLVRAGMAKDTNAIVVANASLEEQKILIGSVSDISKKSTTANVLPPAVLIIGKECRSLLVNQPLFGKKIIMTRDAFGNAELACKYAARGAQAVSFPTFEIKDMTAGGEFKKIVGQIANFDWVFFTSPTGVKLFFKSIAKQGKDARVFAGSKIACIGAETAAALVEYGIYADFVPKKFTSVDLAKEFAKKYKTEGLKILLLRSAFADKLEIGGAATKTFAIYTAEEVKNTLLKTNSDADWITFASSFAARTFFKNVKPEEIRHIKIASIGPITSQAIREYGIEPHVEAEQHTIDGMIEAMENFGN